MVLLCIGVAIALIVMKFVYKATENHTEWVFRKIKISGIKFDIICKLIALLIIALFYLFCVIGLDHILPYGYVIFVYADIIMLFLAPLKWEAEYCVRKKEGRAEYDAEGTAEACDIFFAPCLEIYAVGMIYLKIMNGWDYEGSFVSMDMFRVVVFCEIVLIAVRIVLYRRFKDEK